MLKSVIAGLAAATLSLGLTAGAAQAQDDPRPALTVAVNNLPDSLESIEEMGNVAVRLTYSMFDA